MTGVTDLVLTREREKAVVNGFLEDDDVDHKLGAVPGWKAVFGARVRSTGELVGLCVLGNTYSRFIENDQEIMITRFATVPDRPANTGSWLIAKAKDWAFLEEYEVVSALAGVAGNYGTIYEAAGFEVADGYPRSGEEGDWNNRDDRKDQTSYLAPKRRWVYQLRDAIDVDERVDQRYRDNWEREQTPDDQVELEAWGST